MHHAAPKELITKEWYDGSGAPSLKTSSSSASTTMVYLKRTKAILQVVNSKITKEFFYEVPLLTASLSPYVDQLPFLGLNCFYIAQQYHTQNKYRRNHTQQLKSVHYCKFSDTAHSIARAIVRGKTKTKEMSSTSIVTASQGMTSFSLSSLQKYKEPLAFHYLCSIT